MALDHERKELLASVKRRHDAGRSPISADEVLKEVASIVGASAADLTRQRALLTAWSDLFREGLVSWGGDLNNNGPQWAHLTERGAKVATAASRDPSNPEGYLAGLEPGVPSGSVARSYIEEALKTHRQGCDRAATVLIGVAAEALLREIRDDMVAKHRQVGTIVPKKLRQEEWKWHMVMNAITEELAERRSAMPRTLAEKLTTWSGFANYLRMSRNDAGHPVVPPAADPDIARTALTVFAQFAAVTAEFRNWITGSYS